jgi:hypothetical protein
MEIGKDLEFFMLRAWSLRIDLIHVAPGLKLDVISQDMKQFRRLGAYCATASGIAIDTEDKDEGETNRGVVRLAN